MNRVNFIGGTQSLFDAIKVKDPNSLYFISDTKRIYKGDVDVTQNVFPVTVFPSYGIEKKLYIDQTTAETRVYVKGEWQVITPGFVTTLDEVKGDNGNKLATIDAFKQYFDEVIAEATKNAFVNVRFNATEGDVVLETKDGNYKHTKLEGVAHDASYDAANLRITIPQYGKADLVVDIPHDNFLSDAYYDAEFTFENETTGPAIVLVVKTEGSDKDKKIAIPAASMVNDYKAGKTNNIQVTINDNHKIKANIIIDPETSDGTLMIWDGANQKIGATGVKVNNNTAADMSDSNEYIPTAAVVAAAIRKACKEITDNMLEEGAAHEVVVSTEHGLIRSGMYIGGAVLSDSPNAQTLATEAAVLDAISWKALA